MTMVKKIIQKNEDAILTKKAHPVTQFNTKLHDRKEELQTFRGLELFLCKWAGSD